MGCISTLLAIRSRSSCASVNIALDLAIFIPPVFGWVLGSGYNNPDSAPRLVEYPQPQIIPKNRV